MKVLSNNWLTEGLVDFEYKKYILLAWLQEIEKQFFENRLYPAFSHLLEHYKNIIGFQQDKNRIYHSFPKRIVGSEADLFQFRFENQIKDDDFMSVIEETLAFAIVEFSKTLEQGKQIFETVENNLKIYPIGLQTINTNEGYVFLSLNNNNEVRVYQFRVSIFETSTDKFRGINFEYVDTLQKSYANTFEKMKIDIIRRFTHLPNPATFVVESALAFPIEDTILPLTKRLMIRNLSKAA